jgi:cephalosporin hydroxylase
MTQHLLWPNGDDLKQATYALVDEVNERLLGEQKGIPRIFDRSFLSLMARLATFDPHRPWEESAALLKGPEREAIQQALIHLQHFHARRRQGRYVRHRERRDLVPLGIPAHVAAGLNGTHDVLRWDGVPLFKTPFDMILIQMLIWELKPRTIIEIGSGLGSSACWMADLVKRYDPAGTVLSFDKEKTTLHHPNVRFLTGDVVEIPQVFTPDMMRNLVRPILLIEDAHAHVRTTLEFFEKHLKKGDYIIIEDSSEKQKVISEWLYSNNDMYLVDTYFTDLFGHNFTSAPDSILVCMEERQ